MPERPPRPDRPPRPGDPRIILPGQRTLTAGERLQLLEVRVRELMDGLVATQQAIGAMGVLLGAIERLIVDKGIATDEEISAYANQVVDERFGEQPDTRVCAECGCTASEPCVVEDGNCCSWINDELCSKCHAALCAKEKEENPMLSTDEAKRQFEEFKNDPTAMEIKEKE